MPLRFVAFRPRDQRYCARYWCEAQGTEVNELRRGIGFRGHEEDILWLNVPMDDAPIMTVPGRSNWKEYGRTVLGGSSIQLKNTGSV